MDLSRKSNFEPKDAERSDAEDAGDASSARENGFCQPTHLKINGEPPTPARLDWQFWGKQIRFVKQITEHEVIDLGPREPEQVESWALSRSFSLLRAPLGFFGLFGLFGPLGLLWASLGFFGPLLAPFHQVKNHPPQSGASPTQQKTASEFGRILIDFLWPVAELPQTRPHGELSESDLLTTASSRGSPGGGSDPGQLGAAISYFIFYLSYSISHIPYLDHFHYINCPSRGLIDAAPSECEASNLGQIRAAKIHAIRFQSSLLASPIKSALRAS